MAILLEVAMAICTNPIKISWDTIIFSRDRDIPLYIHMLDVLEGVTCNQELNISIIQLWMM